jgi:uncharacterized caspase-like protein
MKVGRLILTAALGLAVLSFVRGGVILKRDHTPGKLHILSIGINKYRPGSEMLNLQFAVPDAVAIAEAFEKAGRTAAFSGVDVTRLVDDAATRDGIQAAIHRIAETAAPEDVLLFFFAGNGKATSLPGGQRDFEFAVADTMVKPKTNMYESALSARDLSEFLRLVPARQQLVILDSCDSDSGLESLYTALNADSHFTQRALNRQSALFGVEGMELESAEMGHGTMTYAILEGLKGEADADHDGIITEAELEGYLTWKIPNINANLLKGASSAQLVSRSTLRTLKLAVLDHPANASAETRGVRAIPEEKAEASSPDKGKDYYLIFAGDEYANWKKLNNPIYDAEILKQELDKNYGYVPSGIVKNPGKGDVYAALEALHSRKFSKQDRLLLYFAGHGDYNPNTGIGYLVSADTKTAAEDMSRSSFTSFSELRDMIDNLPVEHTLVVLDVCYGGTFDKAIAGTHLRGDDDHIDRNKLIERSMEGRSRMYLASGGVRSVYDGEPGRHSPFARAFLTILRHYGGTLGVVNMDEIKASMRAMLQPTPRAGPFFTQDVYADYVFVANSGARPVPDPSL